MIGLASVTRVEPAERRRAAVAARELRVAVKVDEHHRRLLELLRDVRLPLAQAAPPPTPPRRGLRLPYAAQAGCSSCLSESNPPDGRRGVWHDSALVRVRRHPAPSRHLAPSS